MMKRDYWTSRELDKASKLLADASRQLFVATTYPHSASHPCRNLLPAVKAMIAGAEDCIKAAQPEPPK